MAQKIHAGDDDSGAAIVCVHVAEEQKPVLRAIRDEPIMAADSGWQFTCGAGGHDEINGRVWSLAEVLSLDDTLADYVSLPPGTALVRESSRSAWRTEKAID